MASVWVATTPPTDYPTLEADLAVDVAVLGGGITGLTAAFLLARSGARVAVLDRHRIALGTTGNTTGKVTSQHGLTYDELRRRFGRERAHQYGAANEAARTLIASLVAEEGIDCDHEPADAFTYTTDPARRIAIEQEVEAATDLGLPAAYAETVDLPVAVQAAVRFDGQAQFHARKYCLALAERIRARGGAVFEQTSAVSVDHGRPCRVATAAGPTVSADAVVVATLLPFMNDGLFAARTEPSRSYAIGIRVDESERVGGMYISADPVTRSIRSHPLTGDGAYLIVAGEGHKTGHGDATDDRYHALETWAREHFGVRALEHRWSSQDFRSVDGLPFVGPLTARRDRVLVATGFRKWGITNGTAAAMLLADRLAGRETSWAEAFDSTRYAPRQSAGTFVRAQADVAARFVGDRLRVGGPEPDELGVGAGTVRRVDGRLVAVSRGGDGRLHSVSAVCTHLGCVVRWNSAERSWDCPCHGSRFDADGTVLEGPALRDLGPRDSQ